MRDDLLKLEEIAALARRQREGGFSTQSDAMMSLDLIARLADVVRAIASQEDTPNSKERRDG